MNACVMEDKHDYAHKYAQEKGLMVNHEKEDT